MPALIEELEGGAEGGSGGGGAEGEDDEVGAEGREVAYGLLGVSRRGDAAEDKAFVLIMNGRCTENSTGVSAGQHQAIVPERRSPDQCSRPQPPHRTPFQFSCALFTPDAVGDGWVEVTASLSYYLCAQLEDDEEPTQAA